MRNTLSLAAGLFVALLLIAPASAQEDCGVDSFGYTCTNSDTAGGGPAYDFKNIRDSGVATGLADDAFIRVPLPFSFPFYGVSYDTLDISSNGWVGFAATSSDLSNDPIPTAGGTDALIAALWDDLDPGNSQGAAGEVYYQALGTDKFVVQYDSVPHFPDGNLEYSTFQIALTRDGDIRLTYAMFTDDADFPNSYTVGIENENGTVGIQSNFNGSGPLFLRDRLAVCYDYPGSDPGCDKGPPPKVCEVRFNGPVTVAPNPVPPGGAVRIMGQVVNPGPPKRVKLIVRYNRKDPNGNPGNPMGMLMYGPAEVPPGGPFPFNVRQPIPPVAPPGIYNLNIELVNAEDASIRCDKQNTQLNIGVNRVAGVSDVEFVMDDPTLYIDAQEALAPVQATVAPGEIFAAPNPFMDRTSLTFATEESSNVRLAVYDVLGREVAVLVDGELEAGTHQATFDARSLAAGVYVYHLTVGSAVQSGQMMVVR